MSELAQEELVSQLEERDQLIAALTLQLEQAAEQLDRYQRQGSANRTSAQIGAGSHAHHSAQQEVATQLEQLNQSWDDFALSGTMGRVELQLNELRDLFFEHVVNANWAQSAPQPQISQHVEPEEEDDHPPITSVLEAFSDLYEESAKQEAVEPEDSHEPEAPPPEEVDLDHASSQELADAIIQRDLYIRSLIRRQRELTTERLLSVPTDWEQLAEAPEELTLRLQELESQLNERLRMAEVTFSIERGRLAREQARLDQYRMKLDKQAKSLGLTLETDEIETPEQAESKGKKNTNGRWKSYLGIE